MCFSGISFPGWVLGFVWFGWFVLAFGVVRPGVPCLCSFGKLVGCVLMGFGTSEPELLCLGWYKTEFLWSLVLSGIFWLGFRVWCFVVCAYFLVALVWNSSVLVFGVTFDCVVCGEFDTFRLDWVFWFGIRRGLVTFGILG